MADEALSAALFTGVLAAIGVVTVGAWAIVQALTPKPAAAPTPAPTPTPSPTAPTAPGIRTPGGAIAV